MQTIGERFEKDREQLLPLPQAAFEACETRTSTVTSLSLVRYPDGIGNDFCSACDQFRPVQLEES